MSEWKTIDTAPRSTQKDQVVVMLWVARANRPAFGRIYDDGEGGIILSADGYMGDWDITHWMPLPESPK